MALEELKDKIKEAAQELWSKIESSPAYNNLKEKFEMQSPGTQRGIIASAAGFVILFLLSFPLTDLSLSSDQIDEYTASRDLLRGLLRASRLASDASSVPMSLSPNEVQSQIRNQLVSFNLQPEQIEGVVEQSPQSMGKLLAPATITQDGLQLRLKKLNLKQLVDIGFELQKLNPSVKIAGMNIAAASPDPHYFDVVYDLVVFSMPQAASDQSSTNKEGASKFRSRDTEETDESAAAAAPDESEQSE